MNRVCDFIIENSNSNDEIHFSTMEDGAEMNMKIDELCEELENYMGDKISNIEKYYENEFCQRKVIISFIYNEKKYKICEHYDTQRDYLCVESEKI